MQKQLIKRWGPLVAVCLLGVPVVIYVFGSLIVGPYQGDGGLLGMMGAMYADALTGHPAALILLFAPALLLAIWIGAFYLRDRLLERTRAQGQ